MQPSPDQNAHDDVTTAFRAYLQAMLDGDTEALDNLLADGCTLTHITGYCSQRTSGCRRCVLASSSATGSRRSA